MILLNVKEKIIEISKLLDELDEYNADLTESLSKADLQISDLYHFLETMALDSKKCYRFCKELKSILNNRRVIKKNISLMAKYKSQNNKLINGKENRQLLLSEIGKCDKQWESKYHNSAYTEEELIEKIGV